jgi:hypothetical protein
LDNAWWTCAAKTPFYQGIIARNWMLILKKMAAIQVADFLVSFECRLLRKFLPEYIKDFQITFHKKILLECRKMAAYKHLWNFCLNYLFGYS